MWLKAKETGPSKPIRQTEPHTKRLYSGQQLSSLSSRLTFHIRGLFWHISELLLAVLNEQSRFIQQVSKLRLKGAYWTIVPPGARAEYDMCPVLYWHPSPCSPDCYKCDKLLIGKTLGASLLSRDSRGFCNHRPSLAPDQIPAKYRSSGWKLCHWGGSVSDENWVKSPARHCLFCAILFQNCSRKIFKIFGDKTFVGDVFTMWGSLLVTVWHESRW